MLKYATPSRLAATWETMHTITKKKTSKKGSEIHNEYHFVVNWSEEDQCYIGRCPDLFVGGVHGDDPEKVFAEIRELAGWVIETHGKDGKPLPLPSKKLELA
jgi:predicted RNase H-like HicB family nuclease